MPSRALAAALLAGLALPGAPAAQQRVHVAGRVVAGRLAVGPAAVTVRAPARATPDRLVEVSLVVDDARGSGAGWELTAELRGARGTAVGFSSRCLQTCTPPANGRRYPLDLPPDTPTRAFGAAPGSGMGPMRVDGLLRVVAPPATGIALVIGYTSGP